MSSREYRSKVAPLPSPAVVNERQRTQQPLAEDPVGKQKRQKIHDELIEQTEWMLWEWLIVICVNFVAHFMRVSVVMAYATQKLGASEFASGLMVTVHMLCVTVSNSYICYWIDHYPFEKLMLFRFSLLTLATLGEYLAQTFLQFALVYCVASLSIVWFGVQSAYIIRMLPPLKAKKLCNLGGLLNQLGAVLGIGIGGIIGGLTSLRFVFLTSFILSVLSLLFIVFFVRGKESHLCYEQTTQISHFYRDYPLEFNEDRMRFPMAKTVGLKGTLSNVNESTGLLLKSDEDSSNVSLFSFERLPFWIFVFTIGMHAALLTEITAWWNVYCQQRWQVNIALSNLQIVIGIAVNFTGTSLMIRFVQPSSLERSTLLNVSIILGVISLSGGVLLFWVWFPTLDFDQLWWALPINSLTPVLCFPFYVVIQVMECPAQTAGLMFAVNVGIRSLLSGVQHVIIGALWNVGGPSHPWFLRWFAILYAFTLVLFVSYYLIRTKVDRNLSVYRRNALEMSTHKRIQYT